MPDRDTKENVGVAIAEIYREQYAHFRSMHDILYRIPPLFSVAIGGLWFFGASQMRADKVISVGVFLFAAILAVSSVFIVGRFGMAFSAYIKNLNKLDGEYRVSLKPDQEGPSGRKLSNISTVKIIQILLWIACGASVVAAVYVPFAYVPPAP